MGFSPTRLTLRVGARRLEPEGEWAQRLWGSQGTRSSWSLTGAPKESEVQSRRDGFIGGSQTPHTGARAQGRLGTWTGMWEGAGPCGTAHSDGAVVFRSSLSSGGNSC